MNEDRYLEWIDTLDFKQGNKVVSYHELTDAVIFYEGVGYTKTQLDDLLQVEYLDNEQQIIEDRHESAISEERLNGTK